MFVASRSWVEHITTEQALLSRLRQYAMSSLWGVLLEGVGEWWAGSSGVHYWVLGDQPIVPRCGVWWTGF